MANPLAKIIISAVDQTKAAFSSVNASLKTMQTSATAVNGIFARFLPLLGAATVTSFAKNLIDSADAMNDISERTGIGIERIAAWKLVTEQSGTSLESMTKALDKSGKYLVENNDKLKMLGINASTAEEVIFQLADTISSLDPENPERIALATQVFGDKLGGQLIPLLSLGGDELRRMVDEGSKLAQVYKELGPEADQFNDSLSELKLRAEAAGAQGILPLVSGVNSYLRKINEADKAGNGFESSLRKFAGLYPGFTGLVLLFDKFAESSEKSANNVADTAASTEDLTKRLKVLENQLTRQQAALAASNKTTVVGAYKENIDALKGQIKGFEDLQKAMVSAYSAAGTAAQEAQAKSAGFLASAGATRQNAADQLLNRSLRDATPEEQDGARNRAINDALDKASSARTQADFQRIQGNNEAAQTQLDLAEEQGRRAAELADQLNDEGLAYRQITDAAEALARIDESRAAIELQRSADETARQESLAANMAQNEAQIASLTARLEELNAKVKELSSADNQIKISTDQEAIDKTLADIAKVQAQIAALPKQVVIPIKVGGGEFSSDTGATAEYASGGAISGPGTGTSDSILARLSNGEFVVRAAAARRYGLGYLNALNDMRLPRFASGGLASRISMPSLPASSAPASLHRGTFNFPGGVRGELSGAPDIFDALTRESLRLRRR